VALYKLAVNLYFVALFYRCFSMFYFILSHMCDRP